MRYTRRPPTCEAMAVTTDTATDVAEWADGMAMPDGSVLYRVGDIWLTAPTASVLYRQNGTLTHTDAETFDADWQPVEDD